jgi:fructokinase
LSRRGRRDTVGCNHVQEPLELKKREHRFCLVGLGEILWDLLPQGKQLGGAPANFAYHAAALGAEAAVASCVGADELGREMLARLDALKLERLAVAIDPKHPTGTVTVELDADGRPRYTIHEGVAWDFIPFGPALADLAVRADAVCFGSLAQRAPQSRQTIETFLDHTLSSCLHIFDVNLRQSYYDRQVLLESLKRAHVVKLNDEELPRVCELLELGSGEDSEAALHALVSRYSLRLAVLTCGPAGSLLISPEKASSLPGRAVTVADTVGAGDAFTAAIALGVLQEADLESLHKRAARLAAYVCTQPGATPPVPEELKKL